MNIRSLSREEIIDRLRLPIDPATFDHGICHLYAHALIDRAIGSSTTSFRESDIPIIERYFRLLSYGVDRGAAIRRMETMEDRKQLIDSEPRAQNHTLESRPAARTISAADSPKSELQPILEDEVERAVASARDRLRIELHEAFTVIAADADRIRAKQSLDLKARIEAGTREALKTITAAREDISEELSQAARLDLQNQIEAVKVDTSAVIAAIRRVQVSEILSSIRETGTSEVEKAVASIEKSLKESETQIRNFCNVEARSRAEATGETMCAEIRVKADAALAETASALTKRAAAVIEEAIASIRGVGDATARDSAHLVARIAEAHEANLRELASELTATSARAAVEFQPLIQEASNATVKTALEKIGEGAQESESRVRALAESEVRTHIDAFLENSLTVAREKIEGQFLASARESIKSDVESARQSIKCDMDSARDAIKGNIALAEQRLSEKIDAEITRFETRIHTCFELAREVSNPAPPRNRIESFHAFLSGLTDLLWPLWSIFAGPGHVYARRRKSEATATVVEFPGASEKEKAA